MNDQPPRPTLIASLSALHPYQLACMVLSVIAILGALAIIFVPSTGEKLNDGSLALIGSIVSFWMGKMSNINPQNGNNKK